MICYVAPSGLQIQMLPSVEICGNSCEQIIIDSRHLDLLFGDRKYLDCGSGFRFELFPNQLTVTYIRKCDVIVMTFLLSTHILLSVLTVAISVSHELTQEWCMVRWSLVLVMQVFEQCLRSCRYQYAASTYNRHYRYLYANMELFMNKCQAVVVQALHDSSNADRNADVSLKCK